MSSPGDWTAEQQQQADQRVCGSGEQPVDRPLLKAPRHPFAQHKAQGTQGVASPEEAVPPPGLDGVRRGGAGRLRHGSGGGELVG
ncbi:MAG: hypothetical protein ACK55I_41640, partial [bacterium]